MCRSIAPLRPPYLTEATADDVRAAALQYVRKVAAMRQPAARNRAAFDAAVDAVAEATRVLLAELEVRPASRSAAPVAAGRAAATSPS